MHSATKLCVLNLFVAATVLAWPVDWIWDVEVEQRKFIKLPSVDFVEFENASFAEAEWLPDAAELLLTGRAAGNTNLLLGAQGKMAVWKVRVNAKRVTKKEVPVPKGTPSVPALDAAQKACRQLKWTPLAEPKLSVVVENESCRAALKTLFQTDTVEARFISLEFAAPMLQAQLKDIQAALDQHFKNRVKTRYVGAGLVVEGTILNEGEHKQVLWLLFSQSLGRVALDDRLEIGASGGGGL
jgi:hypothetical protein